MKEQKLSVGIIGVGGMGSVHLASLLALSETYPIVVKAIADLTPENLHRALEKCPNAKGYKTGDELLDNEKLDIIYVTVPSYLHAPYAIRALDNGAYVFVEKPLTLTKEDGEKMLEAEKRSGKLAMVGQVVRFFPEFLYLKKVIEERRYGALQGLDLLRESSFPSWGYENWFYDDKRSGSVILDLHIHDVDYLRFLFPDLTLVKTSASFFKGGECNRVLSLFKSASCPSLSAEGIWHLEPGVPFVSSFRCEFDEATVLCKMFVSPSLTVYEKTKSFSPAFPSPSLTGSGVNISDLGSYFSEDSYFLDCIVNHKPNTLAPWSEGYRSLLLGLEEKDAAYNGRKS